MNWTTADMPNQHGKTVLVTGANSGLGYEIALAMYLKGAHVIMASRDAGKAAEAMDTLKKEGGAGSLELGIIDLSNLNSIKEFSQEVCIKHNHIDILINNAGVMTPPPTLSRDGFEQQFAVNFLGHFALTGYLYPLLEQATQARVVTLSSGAHKLAHGIDYTNLKLEGNYDANTAYNNSKLANLLFMTELHRRSQLAGNTIISTAAHPGVSETGLARFMDKAEYNLALEKFGRLMPAWQGALPALYAATHPTVKGLDYYGPDGEYELKGYPAPAELSTAAQDAEAAAKLWDFASGVTGIKYP